MNYLRPISVFASLLLIGAVFATRTAAAAPPSGPGPLYVDWMDRHAHDADPEPTELKLINYFFTRASVTNQLADPSGLRGVSLGPIGIGENIGSATRVGDRSQAYYIEQRWIPVLSYSPLFIDGLATFRAQFEVDFMWGQAANQLQHNQGGGLNADQVNIQTKNVNVGIYPTKNPAKLGIIVGTQSIYDSVLDPTTTSLFDIVRTGYKLSFIGTDATGISAYGNYYGQWKAMFIPIGSGQPDKATDNDARLSFAWMGTLDYSYPVVPGTNIGFSYWHLQDDTEGSAFAYEGLVKSGPGSTGLFPYTGTARFNIEQASGSVEYVGVNFNHNINFRTSNFGASGFVMLNAGNYSTNKVDTALLPEVDILGAAANLELMYNYGSSLGDQITLEGMLTTGDSDLSDGKFTSAFTLNNYGLPGAVWFNHKTLILFPFTSTVNNYTGAVTDISNQGFGLMATILTAAYDVIPNTLNVKVGAAYAQTAVTPPNGNFDIPRGKTMGAELNVEVKYQIRYLMTVGLHLGYLAAGNFYDANPQVIGNPWAAFTTFTWYAF